MKSKITFLLFLLCTAAIAQDVTKIWSEDHVDPAGSTTTFASGTDDNDITYYVIEGPSGLLLAARDMDGSEVYTVDIPPNDVTGVANITVDNANDYIYVVGNYIDSNKVGVSRFEKSTGTYLTSFGSDAISFSISYDVVVDSNGDVLVASIVDVGGFQYRLTRFSMVGDQLWDNQFTVGDGFPRAMAIHPTNGDIILAGSGGPIGGNIRLMSISNTGTFNWEVDEEVPGESVSAQGVIIGSDDTIVISGPSDINATGFIRKYDVDGNEIWAEQGISSDVSFGLVELPGGNFIAGGGKIIDPNTSFDSYLSLTSYDSEGGFLWTYNETELDSSIFYDVQLLSNGNVVGVGSQEDGGAESAFIAAYEVNILNVEDVDFKNSFSVAPNPANDRIYIQIENATQSSLTYTISNVMGQEVVSGNLEDGLLNHTINIARLTKGAYILSVNSDVSTFSRKVMVE